MSGPVQGGPWGYCLLVSSLRVSVGLRHWLRGRSNSQAIASHRPFGSFALAMPKSFDRHSRHKQGFKGDSDTVDAAYYLLKLLQQQVAPGAGAGARGGVAVKPAGGGARESVARGVGATGLHRRP